MSPLHVCRYLHTHSYVSLYASVGREADEHGIGNNLQEYTISQV